MIRTLRRSGLVVWVSVAVAACATTPPNTVSVPPNAGVYKVGIPYQIDGTWYYPREQPSYDETGIASWYGPTFYGHRTANGEVFDAGALTAAHRTLPMPVNVRVTNLDNGKSIIVRVNDRGPYAKGRIIDLSEHAAELLGYKQQGTARVRVTFVARADLSDGSPPPSQTPPLIASAAAAAPTAFVASNDLAAVPGVAVDPAPNSQLPQTPTPVVTTADAAVDTQPTGIVTQVPVPAQTHLYVQVGAFTTYSNAQRLSRHLGEGLEISSTTRNGQTLYRVRLGPFDELGDADKALAHVMASGSNDAKIIVDQ